MTHTKYADQDKFEENLGVFKENILNSIPNSKSIAIVFIDENNKLCKGYISNGGEDTYKLISGLQFISNELINTI